jgi:hypothetical protein
MVVCPRQEETLKMETAKKKTGTNVVGGFIAAFAFATCRAAVMQHPAAASPSIHDQLVQAVAQQSPSLPKKLNDDVYRRPR